jgi:hypothetical protein
LKSQRDSSLDLKKPESKTWVIFLKEQSFMADKGKMKCNVPQKSDRAGKKRMVKACSGGQEKLIHFGASGYGHNYSSAARKSFKARHKCDTAKDKLTARYWACKNLWAGKGGSTQSSPKSRKGKY